MVLGQGYFRGGEQTVEIVGVVGEDHIDCFGGVTLDSNEIQVRILRVR